MGRILPYADRLRLGVSPVVEPLTISSPITGWNTRDALDAMEPTDAVTLDNWYPDTTGVNVRNGYQSYATGLGSASVATLAEYNSGATRKFIAACSGKFFDISGGGAVGAPLATGFASDQWQNVNFLGKTFFMNGADTMQIYDGSAFAASTFSGVTLATLIGGIQYQNRLFFWAVNSTGFWYAPLNSITGALSFFDLSAFSPHGGNLIAAVSFSHDGGNGVIDVIAFIMSSGDCLLYYGNDPSLAANWQLVGIYRISPPVNVRSVCQYGAEAFLTTFDDHVPLQQQLVALKLGQLPPRSKVSTAVQEAVQANSSAFGWQALYYPKGRRLIFNIPNPDGSFSQHVQNTGVPKQPWCRFVDMNAYCWGLFRDALYFGGAGGVVYAADTGNLDLMGAVQATAQQAWNTFDDPLRKRVAAVNPIVQSVGSASYNFGIGTDYGDINVTTSAAVSPTGSPWDISPWDTSPWSADSQIDSAWHVAGDTGVAIGLKLVANAAQAISWLRTDLRVEKGTAL